MKIISLNVGLPRLVEYNGEPVATGIFKEPVPGPLMLRALNLDGDRQADLSVHGGVHKAVYGYPSEHYEFWRKELPEMNLPYGMFGENFTTEGLFEDAINIGDRFRIGEAELIATQPRLPCYKLGIRFQANDLVKKFLVSRRTGLYLAVTREGEVGAGDEIRPIGEDENAVPVSAITHLYIAKEYDEEDIALLRKCLNVRALPESWKQYFRERLANIGEI